MESIQTNPRSNSKSIILLLVLTVIGLVISWFLYPILMIYIPVISSLIVYLIVRLDTYKSNEIPENFFLYEREMPEDEFVPTYIVSNIGLFSSIIFSTILAYYYGIGGMVLTMAAWFLGMYLFSLSIPSLLPFFKKGSTIHEFIAEKYSSDPSQNVNLRVWTSLISFVLYFASVGIEIKVGSDIFAPSLGNIESITLSFVIAAIGISYTYLSGYKGVVFTDKIQYYIMFFMSFAFIIISIIIISTKNFVLPGSYFALPSVLISPDPYGLFSLIVLLILYQFCIMDMWQRCIAISQTKSKTGGKYSDEDLIKLLKKSTFKSGIIPFLFFFLIWFLIGITVLGTNLTDDINNILPAFINLINSYGEIGFLLKGIIFTGLAAAVLSTVDTFLLASVQTLMYDIYGTKIIRGLTNSLTSIPVLQKYRFVNISRIFIIFVGLFSVVIAFTQPNLLAFWTGMYSIMLSFFPAVYFAIKGKNNLFSFNTIKYSIIIGSLGALILGIIGTYIYANTYIVNSAPLFATIIPYLILKSNQKSNERAV